MGLPFASIFQGRSVFVTGHTGFKGSWLCEWLLALGARVTGYSLPPSTRPALFDILGLRERVAGHVEGDIMDLARLKAAVKDSRPDFVFHFAAQPLVRNSYEEPLETFGVNALGTAHVLEALRERPGAVAVLATTDKCYENREWLHGYREEDPLGGHDPYSASKACAELIISSYRRSFLQGLGVKVASARAGNVIGGGDWSKDRLVPDCARSLSAGEAIKIRRPDSTRPWQHVLEPLAGYLWLAARLDKEASGGSPLCSAFNFGPGRDANRPVRDLVAKILETWPGSWEDQSDPASPHEAGLLFLSTDKAHALLGWSPVWDFDESVFRTIAWYRMSYERPASGALREYTLSQIIDFTRSAALKRAPWAMGMEFTA
jgi:CDP-glucose 4,6-dehydratase